MLHPEASLATLVAEARARRAWDASLMEPIFHVTTESAWQEALAHGEYRLSTRGRSLEEEGFIHCSYRHQLDYVVRTHFEGAGPLVLLKIDVSRTRAELRVEAGPDEQAFPHLYGPLPLDSVVSVERLP